MRLATSLSVLATLADLLVPAAVFAEKKAMWRGSDVEEPEPP
jgi:hypothetical protein